MIRIDLNRGCGSSSAGSRFRTRRVLWPTVTGTCCCTRSRMPCWGRWHWATSENGSPIQILGIAGPIRRYSCAKAVRLVEERGWRVGNADCTVFAQRPKLSPYKRQIAARVADLLGVDESFVNVKAKTGERVGPVGHEESIDASAVVMLYRGFERGRRRGPVPWVFLAPG